MTDYKQAILVRADLKLPKGKMAGQVAHAAVEAVWESEDKIVKAWRDQGQKKVVLKVADEKELFKYRREAQQVGLVHAVISDAGHTVVEPGTITCMAIGPDEDEKIDFIVGKLKLM
jgi:PTH2 family peptidyl-tRNA hydrolase